MVCVLVAGDNLIWLYNVPGIEGASAGNGREYCGSAGGTVAKSVQGKAMNRW